MSVATVFTCDGCTKNFNPGDMGTKTIVGGADHDPRVLLYYCPSCKAPSPKEIARIKPWYIIRMVEEITSNGKIPRWLGRVRYNPDIGEFTDGYGDKPLM